MTDPRSSENPPVMNQRIWPWAQIGLVSLNAGLYFGALDTLLKFTIFDDPISFQGTGGLLMLIGLGVYVLSPKPRRPQPDHDQAVPYSPKLHWLNLGIFGAAVSMQLLSLLLPAISSARQAAQETREAQKQEKAPEETGPTGSWQTVTVDKVGFVIEIPSHWEESQDSAHAIYDIYQIDVANDLLFFLLSVPKEDVTYSGLDAWAEVVMEDVRSNTEESKILERTKYAAPGPPTIELLIESTSENTRLKSLSRLIETPKHFLWMHAGTTRSKFRAHEETLCRIIRSARPQ